LAAQRGVVNEKERAPLSIPQILEWVDAYHARSGQWPTRLAGSIPEAPQETWSSINTSLITGSRGLPGGSSLPRLLAAHRGVPNRKNRPPLTVEQILEWADAHYARHGRWPRIHGDRVEEVPDETWSAVESALQQGSRGLPGGTTLYRLLQEHRGVRCRGRLPELTARQILEWADAYYARHGCWPQVRSGPVEDAPGETWAGIDSALHGGYRGLPGDSSLHRLIRKHRKG
jgi:hypothetical protein